MMLWSGFHADLQGFGATGSSRACRVPEQAVSGVLPGTRARDLITRLACKLQEMWEEETLGGGSRLEPWQAAPMAPNQVMIESEGGDVGGGLKTLAS